MIDENYYNSLAILTPSRVTTKQRYGFAKSSLSSLRDSLGANKVDHVVVHDSFNFGSILPKPLHIFFNSLRWDAQARLLYADPEIIWVDGDQRGSTCAMLKAVNVAISLGKTYGFIHLDDHVYAEGFGKLLTLGLLALEENPNLLWTRFSGYPLIFENKTPITPDANDQVVFDDVRLSAIRQTEYTLWSSPLNKESNQGNYWPIAMWFSTFRLSFLKLVLEWAIETNAKHLAHVELYYKSGGGYEKLMNAFPEGNFGYINMQFGGIEMHRNLNWKTLITMPNKPIR